MSDSNQFRLIPHVNPKDPITADLFNSVIDGVNTTQQGANAPAQSMSGGVGLPLIIRCKFLNITTQIIGVQSLDATGSAYGPQWSVALPDALRGTLAPSGITISRTGPQSATITGTQGAQSALIAPAYDANLHLYAINCGNTGVQGSDGYNCRYVDLNVDGRTWGVQM